MTRHPADVSTTLPQLRQQAEALLQQTPPARLDGPAADPQRLIHELQVHQAELAIQNEELRQQQQALTAARDQYAALYDLAPVGYVTLDISGEIVAANLTVATLLGVPRSGLIGTSLTRAILPSNQDTFYFHRQRVFETQTTQTCDLRLQRPDGTVFVACLESRALAAETGPATRCLTTLSDITVRVRAEEALRASEARRHAILGAALCGIITIDEHGIIEMVNPAVERLFGYRADELLGQSVRLLMPSPDREAHDRYLARYRQTGEKHIIGRGREVRGQRRDGTTFPLALAVSEVYLEGRRCFTGIVHDLSARVQAEEALQQAHDRLEQRVRERTSALAAAYDELRRFADLVSHDLRAPLINVQGFTNELAQTCEALQAVLPAALPLLDQAQRAVVSTALEQEIPEAMGFIRAGVSRMDALLRAVATLSRLGHRPLHYEAVDMEALVQECMQALAHQLRERQGCITVGPLPTVQADALAMSQIVSNLLSNAINALVPGRPGELHITATAGPESTAFHIQDNGRGIAADDIPRVFEMFHRLALQASPGEGMGLAYVRTLVRRHGGDVTCHSTPGVGTTFTFTLANRPGEGSSVPPAPGLALS